MKDTVAEVGLLNTRRTPFLVPRASPLYLHYGQLMGRYRGFVLAEVRHRPGSYLL